MNNKKKTIIITVIITALVTFVLTNAIYVIMALASGDTFRLELAKNIILQKYIDPNVTDKQLTDTGISSMMKSINDKYGRYLTGDDYKNIVSSMTEDHFIGLGVFVSVDAQGSVVVVQVNEGTPAEKAGLASGDIILKVDGTDVNKDNYTKVIGSVKQKNEGESILLTVKKHDTGETTDLTLTLKSIKLHNVSFELLPDSYGYIRIAQFDPGVKEEFNEAVDSLMASNIKGLIIDLRNNPGGLVSEVVPITDRLLPKGVISTVRDKNGNVKETFSSDDNSVNLPMMVLINENTASAAEFLTGALVDFKAAKTIGTKTYGKAVGQSLYPVGKDSGLYMTDSKFYLPRGESIDGVGIEPDYKTELPKDINLYTLPKEKDPDIIKALELLKQAA